MTEPTPKTPGANAESSPLNLRAPHDVIAQLTRVASKLPPGLFSKHRLAVLALEHGLAVIERDPMILLRGPAGAPVESPSAPSTPLVAAAPSSPEAPAPARPKRGARPKREAPAREAKPAVRVETTPENDELRARYVAAANAGSLTHRGTAERVGCSDKMLRMWASGERRNLGQALLNKIKRVLKGLDAQIPLA